MILLSERTEFNLEADDNLTIMVQILPLPTSGIGNRGACGRAVSAAIWSTLIYLCVRTYRLQVANQVEGIENIF